MRESDGGPSVGDPGRTRHPEMPDICPGPTDLLFEVAAAGLGYVDALICEGRYQIKPRVPATPGHDVAARIVGAAAASAAQRKLVSGINEECA